MLLEDAQLCKKFGYIDLAKKLFSSLINESKYQSFITRITGLWTCGEFFSDNMNEDPNVIYRDYFKMAKEELFKYQKRFANVADKMQSIKVEKMKIFKAVAKFADKIYSERDKYLNSSEYKEKCQYLELTHKEVEKLSTQRPASEELQKEIRTKQYILMKNSELDKLEIKNICNDRNLYLSIALEYYISLAAFGENCDVYISRLVSLWCSNHSNENVINMLTKSLDEVPSYKFLKVLPQLASRLGNNDTMFTKLLTRVLVRCCADHPYHSLNHIMALQNANYDAEDQSIDESGRMLQANAKAIIQELQKNPRTKGIIKELNEVNIALIELANKHIDRQSSRLELSANEKIIAIGTKRLFHLPTVNLPIRRDCNYNNIICKFFSTFLFLTKVISGITCFSLQKNNSKIMVFFQ